MFIYVLVFLVGFALGFIFFYSLIKIEVEKRKKQLSKLINDFNKIEVEKKLGIKNSTKLGIKNSTKLGIKNSTNSRVLI